MPCLNSEMLYQQLLEAGQITELYLYEGDDHNLSNNFSLAMQRTIEFFETYLKE